MTPPSQAIFTLIDSDDLDGIAALLDADPMAVHSSKSMKPGYQPNGWSALTYAASEGKLAICRLLVERGAEVYTNPMNTYPPVIQAAWKKHQDVVDYFLREIPDKADGTNGLGVMLNLAAREGWTEIAAAHIARDPLAVHQRGWIGDTPLHWPSHNNYAEIVTMLIDAGADVNADEIRWIGGKPLHWASERATDCIALLLANGADVNARVLMPSSKFYGATPLIWNATQRDDCGEASQMLIDAGADLGAVDATGKTAMAHAQERGLTKITEVLSKAGAK